MIPRKVEVIEKHDDYWIIKDTDKGVGGNRPITDGETIMISGGVVKDKETGNITVYKAIFLFNDETINSNKSVHK